MPGVGRGVFVSGMLLVLLSLPLFSADTPAAGPNSDPTYQQLRNITLGGEAVAVNNFALKREAATFHLRSGTVCFLAAVQGKVTGAVFVGDGNFVIQPPSASERSMLKLLTKEDEFSENFSQAVFRFTDSTYDEIKKTGNSASGGCDAGLLKDSQNTTRHNRELKFNLEARILEDVLSPAPGGLFVAFVHGKRYNGKELFTIDPHSSEDQVELMTYDENKYGEWMGLDLLANKGAVSRNRIHIEHQQLDTTIEKSANLIGKASTTFVSQIDGLRVVPLELFHTLRVDSVTAGGQALPFIQEDKHDDADFAVILPKPLAAGEKYTLTTTYSGKEAVTNEGGGNYFPVARSSWYPNNPNGNLGEYTSYDMTFHIPKGMKMAATGDLVSENNDGGQNLTVWKSEVAQTVAGFNFGRFKVEEAKLTKPEYLVQSFANQEPPDWVRGLQHEVSDDMPTQGSHMGAPVALGTMGTTGLNKKALAEGQIAVQLYSDYFGPSSYKRMALTQQTACNFGQSWPQLIWIPICYFFDTTVRHSLGMDLGDRGYWKVVTPHEVAHQWWGHTVGFSSYRDQWMSEGFADFSAALYLQSVYAKEPRRYLDFWKDERELLTERNKEGFRAIDAGPLTMGYRMSNTRTGFDTTRRLIYPKGAYVLHMIRMMMWDHQAGDQNFKATMQDFVKTYAGKAATTEDFKAMVEKHMTPEMDLEGNHRMDWFFNEYVYGTALPSYQLDYSFGKDSSGDVEFGFKVTQSGVDDKFRMIVPIYLELADGRTLNLGRARIAGNTSVEQKVPIRGLKTAPKRALVNYNYDVLASN
ncbi:MAG: M1 family aminopeptidase [Terriglobales bacterium]